MVLGPGFVETGGLGGTRATEIFILAFSRSQAVHSLPISKVPPLHTNRMNIKKNSPNFLGSSRVASLLFCPLCCRHAFLLILSKPLPPYAISKTILIYPSFAQKINACNNINDLVVGSTHPKPTTPHTHTPTPSAVVGIFLDTPPCLFVWPFLDIITCSSVCYKIMQTCGLPLVNHLLQHTLRNLCAEAQWVYSVLWRILPRNYPPPKWDNDTGPFDRNKGNKRNWILVWEDGYCDFVACSRDVLKESQEESKEIDKEGDAITTTSLQPELFFKMSHDVYNYGEGLMGKIAADNSHKWIFRDPLEQDISFLSAWQGSVDSYPRTWEAQFKAGIQTIAIIAVGEGLLQLGSTKKVIQDLDFVLMLQRRFSYLQSIPGVFAQHPMGEVQRGPTTASRVENNEAEGQISEKLNVNLRSSNPSTRKGQQPPLHLSGVKRPLEAEHDPSYKLPLPLAAPLNQPPNSAAVVPSMSSLQALLSKLPAVTSLPSYGDPTSGNMDPSVIYIPSRKAPSPTLNTTETTPMMSRSLLYAVARSVDGNCAADNNNNNTLLMGRPVGMLPSPAGDWPPPGARRTLLRPQPDAANSLSDEFEAYNSMFGEIIS